MNKNNVEKHDKNKDKNIIKRALDMELQEHFNKYKQAIILLGARQVGKTTLLKLKTYFSGYTLFTC